MQFLSTCLISLGRVRLSEICPKWKRIFTACALVHVQVLKMFERNLQHVRLSSKQMLFLPEKVLLRQIQICLTSLKGNLGILRMVKGNYYFLSLYALCSDKSNSMLTNEKLNESVDTFRSLTFSKIPQILQSDLINELG